MDTNKWIIKSGSSRTPPDDDPETLNWPENNRNMKSGKPEKDLDHYLKGTLI